MQSLRRVHLYLGCFFAPLLVFFAGSGLWQLQRAHHPRTRSEDKVSALAVLSTLHTGRPLKNNVTLTSAPLTGLASLAALSLVLNVLLGIVLAFRFGHGRPAFWCLFAGAAVPAGLVLWRFAGPAV